MNRLTSWQRKLVYLGGIVLLAFIIIPLGAPATGEEGSGGELAQLRQRYDLGDADLGKVDPSSATMNLVLLGMRGLAANQLWLQHDEMTRTKNWAQMRAVADSIITLQPHYVHVWRFHGWHLAYNVSAQWDLVEDRYYWVKEGAKFTMKGTRRNQRASELAWEVGRMLGQKIGRSDEWMFFRRFFKHDPDTARFKDGPDPEIAQVAGEPFSDNYLAAKWWYSLANRIEEQHGQSMMARPLFRHYPVRSQFDYAEALQRDARVAELPDDDRDAQWERLWFDSRQAWEQAGREWTRDYGREDIRGTGANADVVIHLETSPEERAGMSPQELHLLDVYQNMTNYRYWKARAVLESQPEIAQARQEIYEGQRLFRKAEIEFVGGEPPRALELLETGMAKFQAIMGAVWSQHSLGKAQEGTLAADPQVDAALREMINDVSLIEEALMAVLYYRQIYELNGEPIPADYPLKGVWEQFPEKIPELRSRFIRETQLHL